MFKYLLRGKSVKDTPWQKIKTFHDVVETQHCLMIKRINPGARISGFEF